MWCSGETECIIIIDMHCNNIMTKRMECKTLKRISRTSLRMLSVILREILPGRQEAILLECTSSVNHLSCLDQAQSCCLSSTRSICFH